MTNAANWLLLYIIPHPFDERLPEFEGWTRFYHRDRGDAWHNCAPRVVDTTRALQGNVSYTYIFGLDGKWKVAKSIGYFIPLEEAVELALAEIAARS